jgi:hypothetical protein
MIVVSRNLPLDAASAGLLAFDEAIASRTLDINLVLRWI